MINIINQIGIKAPPFEPTEIEAVAITNIGLMFAHIFTLVFFMLLMIYTYRKIKDIIPIIVIFMFSLMIGIDCISHTHTLTEFSPLFEIFFLVFQSTIFLLSALDYHTSSKNKKKEL